MARSMWRGAIQFGLVTIPVKLYLATEQGGIGFNLLHASCLNRTSLYGIVAVTSVEDISRVLAFARQHGLKVSADYSVKVKLFGNVNACIDFHPTSN